MVGAGGPLNVFATFARHVFTFYRVNALGRIVRNSRLPVRDRDILSLRILWLTGAAYEFTHGRREALELGMTEDDIALIAAGPDAPGWDQHGSLLCQFTDELQGTTSVSEETWRQLSAVYDDVQMIQAIELVGFYSLIGMFVNSTKVALEPGIELAPEFAHRGMLA
jgi:4-carboxymuconolactone decarboxylase